MAKKIAIIILVLLLIFGGVVAYFYFFKKPAVDGTGQGFSLQDLFPFSDSGSTGTTPPPPTTPPPDTTPPDTTPTTRLKLRLITKGPVAGAVVYDVTRPKAENPEKPRVAINGKLPPIEIETVPFIRFIEKASGHISELFFDQLAAPDKVTNTTIPKIYEGLFAKTDGTVALLRYADEKGTIQTDTGILPAKVVPTTPPQTNSTTPTSTTPPVTEVFELKGTYLAQNITTLAVSPDGKNIFTVSEGLL
jgi:hypothetical protein